jgi:Flp pilus assembly protein TadD
MAAPKQTAGLAPSSLAILGAYLRKSGAGAQAVALLRRAQHAHPSDFWINHQLAESYSHQKPPQWGEAIRHYSIAVALRPHSPGARLNLGLALREKGRLAEAIAEYREAIRLKKDYADPHFKLGIALTDTGRLAEAIAEYREAIRLKKDFSAAHNGLGVALDKQGRLDEAIAAYREAIRLKKENSWAHNNLGTALYDKGRVEEAIAAYREALRLTPARAAVHNNLGNALLKKGRVEEAIAKYREAIRLKMDSPLVHNNLGVALAHTGRLDEAIAAYQEAIRLKPDFAEAHCALGDCLMQKGEFAQALVARRRGHEIGSRRAGWPDPSAQWVRQAEQLVALDRKLSAILNGQASPADVGEELRLAWLCQQSYKRLYAASANFYAAAFKAQPRLAEDLQAGHRYNAACAAALAGCGQGKDAAPLDESRRASWRRQALDWLRADLKAWRQVLDRHPDKAGPAVVQKLRHWEQNADFAGVHGAALARLPEAERQPWQKLWADVAGLLAQARGKAAAEAKPKDRSDQ